MIGGVQGFGFGQGTGLEWRFLAWRHGRQGEYIS